MKIKQLVRYLLLPGMWALGTHSAGAQTAGNPSQLYEPLGAQYFLNPYLANPAMAGIDTGLHVYLAYQRPWSDMPGAPEAKSLTADYKLFHRVGIGMNIYNDKAGLLNNTKVAFSYAYHLPLTADERSMLHFGLSGAFIARRLDTKAVNGDMNDPNINAFNRRDNYFEADFGMAFTRKGLTLQGSLPNLVSLVKDKSSDFGINRNLFFAAASYRFPVNGQLTSIEPKVCLRGMKGYDDIIDAGANFLFMENLFNVFGMYHSSKSFSAGAGIHYRSVAGLQLVYHSQTAGLANYTNGTFELDLVVHLFK
ncbi:PorP/SprF family type IX secretion system membrane protein [Chitinophaga oryzae]|uniref:PorP/SprF family type IX secretion system membrane protein n=1 Tax=Chitinophaga oryzae TaxID=2725414 RepID=A0AAE6ZFW8_9BACT|nr:PorP/SprF family type IX secretion system membrane protein [Chitinophaga oryzae]QJB31866.1 PorP/SprF family type IX secretion system membrane protein [Chitinophaga oryzae]QJB38343.1 PorP/SprF family type IX secretion system membrane protein [Chitinophaga oryzae]